MFTTVSLIALALGYKVFVDAGKEKEGLKILGQVIGLFVMVAAMLSFVCGVAKCMSQAGCPLTSKYNCPMMSKSRCVASDKANYPSDSDNAK